MEVKYKVDIYDEEFIESGYVCGEGAILNPLILNQYADITLVDVVAYILSITDRPCASYAKFNQLKGRDNLSKINLSQTYFKYMIEILLLVEELIMDDNDF